MLTEKRGVSSILQVRSYRKPNIESDHFLVGIKYRCRLLSRSPNAYTKSKKFKIESLKNEEILTAYQTKLDERLSQIHFDAQSVNTNWKEVLIAIKQTAEEKLGYQETIKK